MALIEPKTIQIGEHFFLDVRPDDDDVQLRVIVGDKELTSMVKKVDLWGAVFAITDGKMQDDLMPVRQTQMMTFERIHSVRAKRDIKKGDVLRFKSKIDVPLTIVESLKGMLNDLGQPALPSGGGAIHRKIG